MDRQTGKSVRPLRQHCPNRRTNGISPIFLTTVGVTGGIGIDLRNWAKKRDTEGNAIKDENGDSVLEQVYSVDTGTVLTINTKEKKLYDGDRELVDISSALTPRKSNSFSYQGSYSVVFEKNCKVSHPLPWELS